MATRCLIRILACSLMFSAHAADDESIAAQFAKFNSPDGRFAARATEKDGVVERIEMIDVKKNRSVADFTGEVMLSEPQSFGIVWAKDSKCFAANFRAGGRYNTTSFFRWEKNAFAPMQSPEEALYDKVIDPARKRELKAAGMPDKTYLRRIWDSWETVKWIDSKTVEIHGESTVTYATGNDTVDIAISVDATVEFGLDGKSKILKTAEVPARD